MPFADVHQLAYSYINHCVVIWRSIIVASDAVATAAMCIQRYCRCAAAAATRSSYLFRLVSIRLYLYWKAMRTACVFLE